MASATKTTEFRRSLRAKKAGRARKAQMNSRGSTPAFPIHTPESHANAPEAQLPKKEQ